MKTGIELITEERKEQIEKHGFDSNYDSRPFNENGELLQAAGHLMSKACTPKHPGDYFLVSYPLPWNGVWKEKFKQKSDIEKLTIAGALIAAEIDRLRLQPSKCRVCGCTDLDCSGCIEKTGEPCWWVEDDLCSACQTINTN